GLGPGPGGRVERRPEVPDTDVGATPAEHKAHAPRSVRCVVCTISDSKTPETDTSGRLLKELLEGAGHVVAGYRVVKDEPSQVHQVIHTACTTPGVQAVVFTGGTGLTPPGPTVQGIDAPPENRLPGVGGAFRAAPPEEVGAR